jgi:flagella basal body P-ring formation protein FlgA
MLKNLVSLLLLQSFAFALTLERSYEIDSVSVYSTDIAQACDRKFFLFTFPANQERYNHPAYEIVKLFNQFGCKMDAVDFAHVEFTLKMQKGCLKNDIKNHFSLLYPNIAIENIFIKQNGAFDCDEKYVIEEIPNRSSGSFIVVQNDKRLFFRYDVQATIPRYVANTDIERGETLHPNNVVLKATAFDDLHKEYLHDLDEKVAKYRILKDRIITQNMVKDKPLVVQNKTVKCRYKQGNVVIEFEATPMSDGVLGEEIRVKKDLDTYRAKVIGKNLVEIL